MKLQLIVALSILLSLLAFAPSAAAVYCDVTGGVECDAYVVSASGWYDGRNHLVVCFDTHSHPGIDECTHYVY